MSTKKGNIRGHHFHGDPKRFEAVADFIYATYGNKIKYIADVAGGQGMLSRLLNKKYNYQAEVIDPRGYTLVGVKSRKEIYTADMAEYYDLIVGLHPDEATREVVLSAVKRPIIIIPCCNFWDRNKRLGREALLDEIGSFLNQNNIRYKRTEFDFEGPKNIGLMTY